MTVCVCSFPYRNSKLMFSKTSTVSSWESNLVNVHVSCIFLMLKQSIMFQVGSTTLIGAKNIIRPQLRFKDTINNSESLWVPKISDKPNSIKPLALNILYNDEGEAVG